jgi:hypothetical protein
MAFVLLLALSIVFPSVAAQNSAEVSSSSVGIADQGETATSDIIIVADEGVAAADTKVSVDTGVVNITDARPVDETGNSKTDINQVNDGTVWINYTDIQAAQSDFTVGEVDLQAQTGDGNTTIALETTNYFNASNSEFDTVNKNEGDVTVGSTEFTLNSLKPQKETVVKNETVNYSVDVYNSGVLDGTQEVELLEDPGSNSPVVLDSKNVTLTTGEVKSINLTADTGTTGYGRFSIGVVSENDATEADLKVVENFLSANVTSSDTTIQDVGETGNSSITVDAPNGLTTATVTVSMNTTAANITGVRKGNEPTGVVIDILNRTDRSVDIEYTNIQDDGTAVTGLKLAEVEFELRSENAEELIELQAKDFFHDSTSIIPYASVETNEGTLSGAIFSEPLPVEQFQNPPKNIPEKDGGFNDSLVEDLDGDGDPTNIPPTVRVFGKIIRGGDLGLNDRQARALNWDENSPTNEVTVSDMVSLFGNQVRAD